MRSASFSALPCSRSSASAAKSPNGSAGLCQPARSAHSKPYSRKSLNSGPASSARAATRALLCRLRAVASSALRLGSEATNTSQSRAVPNVGDKARRRGFNPFAFGSSARNAAISARRRRNATRSWCRYSPLSEARTPGALAPACASAALTRRVNASLGVAPAMSTGCHLRGGAEGSFFARRYPRSALLSTASRRANGSTSERA